MRPISSRMSAVASSTSSGILQVPLISCFIMFASARYPTWLMSLVLDIGVSAASWNLYSIFFRIRIDLSPHVTWNQILNYRLPFARRWGANYEDASLTLHLGFDFIHLLAITWGLRFGHMQLRRWSQRSKEWVDLKVLSLGLACEMTASVWSAISSFALFILQRVVVPMIVHLLIVGVAFLSVQEGLVRLRSLLPQLDWSTKF